MSEIAKLLEQGARPAGDDGRQLADALLCLAQHVDLIYGGDEMQARLLVPNCFTIATPSEVMDRIHAIHHALTSPDPMGRASAQLMADQLAMSELALTPTQAAPAANYEGKHSNGS